MGVYFESCHEVGVDHLVGGRVELWEVGGRSYSNSEESFDANLLSVLSVDVAIPWVSFEG